ncbi:unnamed protein product [Penicillium salamii]|uniref:Short-chain dehydrogenase/reductase SDR n=1 Tax=Penicillium salamii TaxID=1612424 RepID=A0A9W4MY52_9EURO|nr:unnamed protein product [Penicillium salamii]
MAQRTARSTRISPLILSARPDVSLQPLFDQPISLNFSVGAFTHRAIPVPLLKNLFCANFSKMARILITGSTDGFGLEAARQLIERKHTVYLHARSQERAEDVKAKCPGAAGVLIADLTSVAETRKLAEEANAIGVFDAIILNAGLLYGPFRKTPELGVPAMPFVNVVSPYILACLFKHPKRLIFIGSVLHHEGNPDLKDIFWLERGEKEFQDFPAYCDSKLHVMLLANAVARRFKDTSVISVHPGYVATKLGGSGGTDKLEDGVETYVMLAEGDYDQSLTGVYYEPKKKLGQPRVETTNEDMQEVVVKACEELTGLQLGA